MLRITLLLCLAAGTLAAIRLPGPCPSVTAVTDFDIQKFGGDWYEAERYFALFELPARCFTINYLPNDNGTISIHSEAIESAVDIGRPVFGLMTYLGDMSVAKFNATYWSPPILDNAPYWLVGTDYDNWAVFWSCTDYDTYSSRLAWLLTREIFPSRETLEAAYAVMDANKISKLFLLKTDHTVCRPKNSPIRADD